jgi:AraC family transcriptional regulator
MDALQAIEDAIDYIEAHLEAVPPVAEIATAAGLSAAHFQRLFRAVTGQTVAGYARRRRLSLSVGPLLETDRRILEIALEAGFESQEAFTRAFRAQFGMPPGRFRERGQRAPGQVLPRLTRERLLRAREIDASRPRIEMRESTLYVGIEAPFITVLSNDSDNRDVIPDLWRRFLSVKDRVAHAVGSDLHGLCMPSSPPSRERNDELVYMAALPVSQLGPLEQGFSSRRVEAARYAVFEHGADARSLPDTILHVLADWLPRSPYEYAGGVELDVHSSDPGRPLEYWVPVRERANASAAS